MRGQRRDADAARAPDRWIDHAVEALRPRRVGDGIADRIADRRVRIEARMRRRCLRSTNSPAMLANNSAYSTTPL